MIDRSKRKASPGVTRVFKNEFEPTGAILTPMAKFVDEDRVSA